MSVTPFRQSWYPKIDGSVPEPVSRHLQMLYTALNDHDAAIVTSNSTLSSQIAALKTTAAAAAATPSTGIASFPGLGTVNNQTAAYTLQAQDNGALVTMTSATAVTITLNSLVATPYLAFITNYGAGTLTLTPSTGTINNVASQTLASGASALVVFDGTNWWAGFESTPGGGGVSAKTASYTAVAADNGTLLSFTSATAVTLTLPATPPSPQWRVAVENTGAGAVSLSPNGRLLDGSTAISIATGQGCDVYTDGTNYFTMRGLTTVAGGGVTSVALTMPAEFTVTGSPVTTNGTFVVAKANESANQVYAGPASGAAAAPTFRAVVPADLPVFVASGASHAAGAVPDPGAAAGATRFLREDATFAVPPGSSISLTTTGFSGPSTLTGGVLNIPQYLGSAIIRTASSIGCVLDCNLLTGAKIGGGTPTDNTATINAFLATATATAPVMLIMDGPSACKGIKIPAAGHVTIVGMGLDSGFFTLAGSNNHTISNEPGSNGSGFPPFNPATTPPAQGANVIIRDLFINGNRGNGTTGNSTSGDPRGTPTTWYCGIDLISLTDILIENVTLYDIATFAVRLGNVTRWTVRGCTMNAPSQAINTDGVHIDGPAQDGVISGCYFVTMGDDAIALNAPEGFGGSITRTAISDCTFQSCLTAFRCYSKILTQYTVSDTTLTNCSGSTSASAVFFLGNGSGAADSISDFKASNCTFATTTSYGYLKIEDPCGDITLENLTWIGPTVVKPFVVLNQATTVSSLTLAKCKIYRNAAGNAAAFGVAANAASTITKLALDFAVDNEIGGGYAAIADLINMTNLSIGLLVIENLDPTYISALVTTFTGITTIAGAGVLGSGFQIPDSAMSNDVPYISATAPNAGQPCIKIGGVVHNLIAPPPTPPATHSESLTDGNSNFIFTPGDIITVVGVPN